MNDAYDSMQKRLDGIRDAVTNVANGYFTGVYLCGPRGTGKTWTVEETLKNLGRQGKYDPHNGGGITDGGLLELLWQNDANHLDRNLLLDDCGELFTPKCARARQYLLKALGGKGGTTRYIPYVSAKKERTVEFRRGIFAISNIPLARHNDNVLGALRDRIIVLNHEPTDVELVALPRCPAVMIHCTILSTSGTIGPGVRRYSQILKFVISYLFLRWPNPYNFSQNHRENDLGRRTLAESTNGTVPTGHNARYLDSHPGER